MTARAGALRYLTPPEVAERLRIKVATVREWIVKGQLKALNVSAAGRPKYRIRPNDLEAFEQSKLVAKPNESPVRRTTRKPANYL